MKIHKPVPKLSQTAALGQFGNSLAEAVTRHGEAQQADVVAWCRRHFFINPGETIEPLAHQEALLRLLTSRRHDGRPWKNLIYSTVKKSGKTAIAALLTRYDAEHGPGAREIYLAANDKDQATNRVFEAIRRSILWDDAARDHWAVTSHQLTHANGTFIRAVASDYRGEAGSNPSRTVWTELWGFEHEAARRFFEELTPVPTVESVRFVETSTGYEGQSDLLRDLYDLGKAGRQLTAGELSARTGVPLGAFEEATEPDALVPIWENEVASLVMYWDEGLVARRMPWQRGEEGRVYYLEQEQTLRPSQFKRLHLNQWTQAEEAFLPIEWWDRCGGDVPELAPDERLVVAIDAATRNDGFAIVGVTRHWDAAKHRDHVVVRCWALWTPPRGGEINFEEPFQAMLALMRDHHVAWITYDPYQMDYFADRLRPHVTGFVAKFDQGGDREVADKKLYDMIQAGRILHCNPSEIREHLLNANVKLTDRDRMRIVKRADYAHVDLAVALSMAVHECLRLNL